MEPVPHVMAGPWYAMVWGIVDNSLRHWSQALQRVLGYIRLARALLFVGLAFILFSGLAAALTAFQVLDPRWFYGLYAVAVLWLIVPIAILAVLVGLPLRARSVTRLIDMGYPANGRELLIRVLARKLRDQSIETEELLWETATNEARKLLGRIEAERAAKAAARAASPMQETPASDAARQQGL